MQLNINQTQQNPTFGYFKISEPAQKYINNKLKSNQADKFTKILEKEAENKIVEASIDCNNGVLNGYLRVFDSKGNSYIPEFCQNLGNQGWLSRIFRGPLSYLKTVSEASSDMLLEFSIAKRIEETMKKRAWKQIK